MNLAPFPFQIVDWSAVPIEEHAGDTGIAYWRVKMFHNMRVRLVEYSPGYKANHWCKKGHILFCMEGEMNTELEDGRVMHLKGGMCYFVGDSNEAHRSSTATGCKLFIVD